MKTKARKPAYAKASAGKQEIKKSKLLERVQKCIDINIRPFIQMDGGEIELVELTKKNILKVRLHGACQGCPAAGITLSYGVQASIDAEFPEEDIQVVLVK
jgi:Fe-S cluster biogenesis protein NfuA